MNPIRSKVAMLLSGVIVAGCQFGESQGEAAIPAPPPDPTQIVTSEVQRPPPRPITAPKQHERSKWP